MPNGKQLLMTVWLAGVGLAFLLLAQPALAATITVNSAADTTTAGDDDCTLREAIANANGDSDTTSGDCVAGSGADTIAFSIGITGTQQTITLTNNLPSISDPVILDGWSQGGSSYTGPPLIELDGSNLTSSSISGFRITAGGSTVRGFVIHSFDNASNAAIWLHTADDNWIYGNYIGVDAGGTTALPNHYGVWIDDRSEPQPSINNIIGTNGDGVNDAFEGNVIAGSIQEDVRVETSGNWIAGNYIGTDATGSAALTNTNTAIRLYSGADNTTIGVNGDGVSDNREGNLISGHSYGIGINNSSGHTIAGNIIGLNAAGDTILGNTSNGIDCSASSGSTSRNIVIGSNNDGASDDLEGNVVSGNGSRGYSTFDNGCRHITISRNKFGATITGTTAPGNGAEGIIISAGDWYTITHNLISGNGTNGTAAGILLGNGANNISLTDNIIGSDAAGVSDLGNTGHGIEISFSDNQTVRRNQISGNGSDGIRISSGDATRVEDNLIGVQADGSTPLGNSDHGVYIVGDANRNTAISNTIAFQGKNGLLIDGNSQTISNSISANSVFSNTALGIDLDFDGPNTNDADDSDSGPNNLQNYPVIAAVDSSGGILTVSGTLTSTASTTFTLEFFANSGCDDSGFGEGESYLGADTVVTNGSGRVDFVSAISAPGVEGQYLTATAADPAGNTSEFSECFSEPVGFDPITGLQAENDSPTILGFTTHFTASAGGGSNISYIWDFGDGSGGAGATASHVYSLPGNYSAVVTATNAWNSLSASTPVTITAPLACAATPNNGATLFYSSDASAVQQAVDHPASSGGLVKVAGTCAGVSARAGVTQSVYISQSLTVQGGYHYLDWSTSHPLTQPTTLDGQKLGRVLYITGTLPVTLADLTIQNGQVATTSQNCPADCGGAIISHAPVAMDNLTVQNNQAGRGGAAYLLALATIDTSDWLSNTAVGRGGALYNLDSMSVNNSSFVNNTGAFGGGIASIGSGPLTIENSTFYQNLAESGGVGGGGAIYAAGPATVRHSLIEDNRSFFNGGGLAATDELTIFQTDFISNTAAEEGGGLLSLSVAHIENSRFERNSAQSAYGGGLALRTAAFITATQILTNTADQMGGGLYQPQSSPFTDTIRLTDVTLQSNQALNQDGGGAYIGENLVMINSTVTNNLAEFGDGGGLNTGNISLIRNSTLRQNQAERGGAAYVEGPLTIETSDWLTNTATQQGGGLHARYTTVISGGSFSGNSGSFGGGLAAVGGGNPPDAPINATITLTVKNASFRQNRATSFSIGGGGGVHVAVLATVNNSLFEANSTNFNGGGLAATHPVTLTHTDFISNTADEGGGLLSLAQARIDYGRFERNTARVDGGGLALRLGAVLSATQFLTNTAGNDGGGLYQLGISPFSDNVTLAGVTVQGNEAQQNGGGAFIGETLVMTGGHVSNNASLAVNGLGGGLAVGGSFDVRRSTLKGNQANGSGGGLALTTNGDSSPPASQIINSLLTGNQAETDKNDLNGQNGAGLFLDKGPATVLHTTIANPSQVMGQAIYANGGTEVITVQNTLMASYTTGLAHEFSTQVNSRNNLYFGATLTETAGINSANAVVGNLHFADPGAGDYHLLLGSAAIEAGAAAGVVADFEDDPRPIGSLVDIGFDEFGDGDLIESNEPAQLSSILSTNRRVTVNLPAGAVGSATTLTLFGTSSPNPPITGTRRFVNVAFTLQAFTTGVSALDHGLTFSQPVTVVVEYDDADVADVDEDSLRLDILDKTTETWEDATTTCTPRGNIKREAESNRLSAEVCRTGQFALTAAQSAQSDQSKVYLPIIMRE